MDIDVWKFAAGLMLFLLAMSLVDQAVHALAGRRFKALLAANTQSSVRGILSGTIATAVLQSSSMVSLMMLAFVGARLVKLRNALLVVFGANLGTTATGWIVATIGFKFDLEALALPLIALGGMCAMVLKKHTIADVGRLLLGIGVLLLALQFMKGAVAGVGGLVDPQTLADMTRIEYVLFGAIFSAVAQSSSATMVITLSLLNGGVIDLGAAAALMIGANLGTTSTVMLGAIGGTSNKKRLALGHFLFNLITDLVAFALLPLLLAALAFIADPLLTLVAFHSLFNLLGVLCWTPVTTQFANFLEKRFAADDGKVSWYLEETAQELPETSVGALRSEITHLVERVIAQNAAAFSVATTDDELNLETDFERAYTTTKQLEGEILSYALDLDRTQLSVHENDTVSALLHVTRDALIASKQLKDVLPGLNDVASDSADLYDLLRETQADFYRRLLEISDEPAALHLNQVEELAIEVEEGHQRCHEKIYADIRRDVLPESRMSSVLNLNRSFFNSNRAMLSCIGALAEQHALSEQAQLALA